MGWNYTSVQVILFFLLLEGFASSATFISVGVFDSHETAGRSLLQEKKNCPVDFETQNYTIITSKCKNETNGNGYSTYSPELCCPAFVEFACPFADVLNDGTSMCGEIMYSYININGKYPPGLFASLCPPGPALQCPPGKSNLTSTVPNDGNAGHRTQPLSPVAVFGLEMMLILGFF